MRYGNCHPITSQTLDSNALADRDAIFGIWADRTDISDSVAYSAMLRQRLVSDLQLLRPY